MEQSRRAVESYWRSRMIDTATSDEDKVTPVYKLEEICDLLRSSPGSIVKEVSDFILKRLDHKSPIVKQKSLRIIKYAVGKSGNEFRREMQRHSIAVRQLIHYKGPPDPLKGDALNKAVRETAQETLSALFSSDEAKPAPKETSLGSRIQGFGNTNYEMPSEDKRSFISEVVDIGSATIKQGLSNFTQSQSMRKSNDTGTYRSPNLRRSLTREQDDYSDRYEGAGSYTETQNSSRFSQNAGSGNWGQDPIASQGETSGGGTGSTFGQKTREERLVETIVTSGGVRLQPTRDALQVFMMEASKLNALSLGHAIEAKLRSPMWQVRMKALCVLEAVLRKKDDEHFLVTFSYFSDNRDAVIQCSESPQASLREKANKVLSLLGGEQSGGRIGQEERSAKTPQPSPLPDLLDTGDSDDPFGLEDSKSAESEAKLTAQKPAPLLDDLFGDSLGGSENINGQKLDDDPFADVSFHNGHTKDQGADPFSGMPVDKSGVAESLGTAQKTQPEPFDFFGSTTEAPQTDGNLNTGSVNDLMSSQSISGKDPFEKHNGSIDLTQAAYQDNKTPSPILNGEFASQPAGVNANPMFSMGYNLPPGFVFNPALIPPQMNYGAMGNLLAQQQQFLATMSNFQQLGNLQSNTTSFNTSGSYTGSSSPFPDIFNPSMATQPPTSLMNDSKREDSKAFDFISDHVAAARDSKRVI